MRYVRKPQSDKHTIHSSKPVYGAVARAPWLGPAQEGGGRGGPNPLLGGGWGTLVAPALRVEGGDAYSSNLNWFIAKLLTWYVPPPGHSTTASGVCAKGGDTPPPLLWLLLAVLPGPPPAATISKSFLSLDSVTRRRPKALVQQSSPRAKSITPPPRARRCNKIRCFQIIKINFDPITMPSFPPRIVSTLLIQHGLVAEVRRREEHAAATLL